MGCYIRPAHRPRFPIIIPLVFDNLIINFTLIKLNIQNMSTDLCNFHIHRSLIIYFTKQKHHNITSIQTDAKKIITAGVDRQERIDRTPSELDENIVAVVVLFGSESVGRPLQQFRFFPIQAVRVQPSVLEVVRSSRLCLYPV